MDSGCPQSKCIALRLYPPYEKKKKKRGTYKSDNAKNATNSNSLDTAQRQFIRIAQYPPPDRPPWCKSITRTPLSEPSGFQEPKLRSFTSSSWRM